RQLPDPGNMLIKEGRTITLQVSSGSKVKSHIIPNYIGKPYHQVRNDITSRKATTEKSNFKRLQKNTNQILSSKTSAMNKLNNISVLMNRQSVYLIKPILYPGAVTYVHHNIIPSGQVIKQYPAPGSYFNRDTAINFSVSLGPDRGVFQVGNYKNRSVEQVVKLLSDWNIHPKIVNVVGNSQNTGQVMSQSIPRGKILSPGDSISLSVANYTTGQLYTRYKIFRFTLPVSIIKSPQDQNKAHKLRVVLQDQKGQTVLYEGYKRISESIAECARVKGKGLVWVYINDRHYRNFNLE
ncbi:MAG: PASTA domain-containing protein, partial [Spirochaetota bacterium]|nr:PASTA domain-containing protein [Spirochaetota bacterium]